jgi:hypothetical protein
MGGSEHFFSMRQSGWRLVAGGLEDSHRAGARQGVVRTSLAVR